MNEKFRGTAFENLTDDEIAEIALNEMRKAGIEPSFGPGGVKYPDFLSGNIILSSSSILCNQPSDRSLYSRKYERRVQQHDADCFESHGGLSLFNAA